MSDARTERTAREETAVDDVRRVRERLSREAGGDMHKLVEEARRIAEQYRQRLGLKTVKPPAAGPPGDAAAG